MAGSVEIASGADENVIAETHFRSVQDCQAMIGKAPLAHLDVVAVVAPERRIDDAVIPYLSQQFLEDLVLRLEIRRPNLVIRIAQVFGPDYFVKEIGVFSGVVKFSVVAFLFLGHCLSTM